MIQIEKLLKYLPDEIEIKDEKSRMYLENNLHEIKYNFLHIHNKYPSFFKYIAKKEKKNIDQEILSSKVDDINFYHGYNTLYGYFFKVNNNVEEISIKNNSFFEDLLKGFKFKSAYITTKGENNIEKAYYDLVLKNKKIDDIIYKKVNNVPSDENKNIFQEAKKLFDLRVEIYKKLIVEEENLKFEKSFGETVKFKNKKDNFSETPKQKDFKDFLEEIKEERKNIDTNWFKNVFNYKTPDEMLEYLYNFKNIGNYNQETSLIEDGYTDFEDEVEIMSKTDKKTRKEKYQELLIIFLILL